MIGTSPKEVEHEVGRKGFQVQGYELKMSWLISRYFRMKIYLETRELTRHFVNLNSSIGIRTYSVRNREKVKIHLSAYQM